jgi:hypothetical protein
MIKLEEKQNQELQTRQRGKEIFLRYSRQGYWQSKLGRWNSGSRWQIPLRRQLAFQRLPDCLATEDYQQKFFAGFSYDYFLDRKWALLRQAESLLTPSDRFLLGQVQILEILRKGSSSLWGSLWLRIAIFALVLIYAHRSPAACKSAPRSNNLRW